MKSILIVDTYYQQVIESLGFGRNSIELDSYSESLDSIVAFGFGTGGAYRRELRKLGWDADISVPNAQAIQTLWREDNSFSAPVPFGWPYALHLARVPFLKRWLHLLPHVQGTLFKQIVTSKPEVVFVQDLNLITPSMAKAIRKHTKLLVGEIASPLPPKAYFEHFDLIFSALPTIVEKVNSWGIESYFLPLGFDSKWTILEPIPIDKRSTDAIFVGSFSRHQPQTVPLLRAVGEVIPTLKIYGNAPEQFLRENDLLQFFHGPAWGKEMFQLLGDSKIVINRHGTIAGDFAVNMRMYEATGMGAALVTEYKQNLTELFTPGEEVITYKTPNEAAKNVYNLLTHPERLNSVAYRGKSRTLSSHTYAQRAEELSAKLTERLK